MRKGNGYEEIKDSYLFVGDLHSGRSFFLWSLEFEQSVGRRGKGGFFKLSACGQKTIEYIEVHHPWYSLSIEDYIFELKYTYETEPTYFCYKYDRYQLYTTREQEEELSRYLQSTEGPYYEDSSYTHLTCRIKSEDGYYITLIVQEAVKKDSCGWNLDYKAGDIIRVYFEEARSGNTVLYLRDDNRTSLINYAQIEMEAQYITDVKDGTIYVKRIQCNNMRFGG